jgi:hypothetical protein
VFALKNILLINDFDFEDGKSDVKDKILIVLFEVDDDLIIAPLTTSQDYVPDELKSSRCIKNYESRIHCYYFPKDEVVCTNNFSFWKDTYVHIQSNNIKKRSKSYLVKKYGAARIIFKGTLSDKEYYDFLYCLYKSEHLPRGIKPSVENMLEELGKALS